MRKVLFSLLLLTLTVGAYAAEYVWDGGSFSSDNWGSSHNWVTNTTPTSNSSTDIRMEGNVRLLSDVSSNWTIDTLTFGTTAKSFTIYGDTLSIYGGIMQNSSYNQKINNNITLKANQQWSVKNGTTLEVNGKIAGSGKGIEKIGGGTLILTNVNTYTGTTTITAGTVQLGANNVFADSMPMVLNGGTLDTNGYNDRLGTLTLTADSTIKFGERPGHCDVGDNTSQLKFANSSSKTWTDGAILTVTEWNGKLTGNGNDRLYFGTSAAGLNAQQLAQIKFYNPAGLAPGLYDAQILCDGEVVPVPEPATMGLGALLMGLIGARERKRRALAAQKAKEASDIGGC